MRPPPPNVAAYRQRMTVWTLATVAGVLLFALNIQADGYLALGGVFLAGAVGLPGLLFDRAHPTPRTTNPRESTS